MNTGTKSMAELKHHSRPPERLAVFMAAYAEHDGVSEQDPRQSLKPCHSNSDLRIRGVLHADS